MSPFRPATLDLPGIAPEHLESRFREAYAAAGPARDGLELRQAWVAFRAFLREPIADARVRDDLACYQCGMGTWESGEPGHSLYLSRHFWLEQGPDRPPVPTPAGNLMWGLTVSFLLPPEAATGLGRAMLWSESYPDLGDFLDAVERSPSFQVAMQLRPLAARLDVD